MSADNSEVQNILDWHNAVAEAKEAIFGSQPLTERVTLSIKLVEEETDELLSELDEIELLLQRGEYVPTKLRAAAAKEAADVLFVVAQAMHTLGIPFREVIAEVVRSNYTKLEGGIRFSETGKLLKSDAYSPADVERVLNFTAQS